MFASADMTSWHGCRRGGDSRIRIRKAVSGSAHADCGRIPAITLLARARQVCPPERARKPEPTALEDHSPFPACFQVTHLKILVFQWFSCFRHGVAITPEPHMPTCLRFWKQTLHRLKVRLPFRRIHPSPPPTASMGKGASRREETEPAAGGGNGIGAGKRKPVAIPPTIPCLLSGDTQ